MKRYNVKMIVRDNHADYFGGKEASCSVRANGEHEARRMALELAWSRGCLVTKFLSVAKARSRK